MQHQLNVEITHKKIELDPDSNDGDFYVLTPEQLKREAPQMFKPTQIKTTITPNTITAQDAGIYSNAELDQFWNRVLFAKHSDTTLQLLGKSLSYDFISMHNDKHSYSGHNPYNHLRIGVHDHLLNLLPFLTLTGSVKHSLTSLDIHVMF